MYCKNLFGICKQRERNEVSAEGTIQVAVHLWTHCNIGLKKAFPTGILDRWHNCLLTYWRNVAQRSTPTSYSALTLRPSPKLTHERHILGMSTSSQNDSEIVPFELYPYHKHHLESTHFQLT